ncbi:MAG: hypothetical protein ACXVY3_09900 [Gaiellaceae bacterium]
MVRRAVLLLLAALAVVVTAASSSSAEAGARPAFGFTEDMTKYADDGGAAYFDLFNQIGVTENRVCVFWNPDNPGVIEEKPFLDRFIPQAVAHHITVVFSVQSRTARGYTQSASSVDDYVAFLVKLAETYPQVSQFVIGNEPNQPRFWQPQFNADGSVASAAAYTTLLARSYDALKALNPNITVIGLGLSPRGNDMPHATSNASVSPVRFIKEMGDAYRKLGRQQPLMDVLGLHIYPQLNTDPPSKGYVWPGIGFPNLDRLKQAVWDSFRNTAQPLFEEDGATGGPFLHLKIDEIGWQTIVPDGRKSLYSGAENVPPVPESTQAAYYAQAIASVLCDRSVEAALFFHFVDERDLARFQSGVLAPDGAHKPALDAIREAVSGSCAAPSGWRHREDVDGGEASFDTRHAIVSRKSWSVILRAAEDYTYRAGVLRVVGPASRLGTLATLEQIRGMVSGRSLRAPTGGLRLKLTLRVEGLGKASRSTLARFAKRKLPRGNYVYAALESAATNPERTKLLVSPPFRVG